MEPFWRGAAERTILEIDLDYGVLSAAPQNPVEAMRARNAPSLRVLSERLHEATSDPAIAGLIVHVGTCPLSAAQVDELGDALAEFRTAHPVWAYTESFGELGGSMWPYRLAAQADQVWLAPSGQLGLTGVRASVTLLRGTLDKLGVEPQFGQRKEYKTAADQLAAREITAANREMMQRLANSLCHDTVHLIARRRGSTTDDVWNALDAGLLTAHEALDRRLIDRIGYRDQVYAAARDEWLSGRPAELRYVHRQRPAAHALDKLRQRTQPSVAIVGVHGQIVRGRPQPSLGAGPVAASEAVCEQLRAAGRDELVRAVVLQVESPGGSYIASDQIRREVLQLKASGRPVVASMGDVAASGGYFVAMGATEIVAQPSTLTGSIGVLAGKMVLTGLKQKLGLLSEDITSGAWAGFLSGNREFTAAEWDALNRWLDAVYADFTEKAAADRGLPVEELEPLARGRVWTGADAAERRLVDHLGGLALAHRRACALAELDPDEAPLRPLTHPLLSRLIPAKSSESPHLSTSVPRTATGSLDAALASAGSDELLGTLAARLGLAPAGVLSLPFHIRVQ